MPCQARAARAAARVSTAMEEVAKTREEFATARVMATTKAASGVAAVRALAARVRAAVAMGCGDWPPPRQKPPRAEDCPRRGEGALPQVAAMVHVMCMT